MVITKTPLRISFVGGGSDRPGFYLEEPGACVAAAIDKYVYVALNDKYDGTIRVAYSHTEDVAHLEELRHELAREGLIINGRRGVEIHSIADIPGGTGLGSSSAFTVGLIKALAPQAVARTCADWACVVELDRCKKPIGKQDQYTAAYGGLNLLTFSIKGVAVSPIACDLEALSSHCLLLDTGLARQGDAGAVLAGQQQDRDDVRQLAAFAPSFARELAGGNWQGCGAIMDMAWMLKRKMLGEAAKLDHWYLAARQAGAWGGKLCGAGGGGFLLFLAPPERHAAIVGALGLRHVPIRIGVEGSTVVYHS